MLWWLVRYMSWDVLIGGVFIMTTVDGAVDVVIGGAVDVRGGELLSD